MTPLKNLSLEFLQKRHSIQAYLYSLVGDVHQVEDLLQEVWVRLADAAEKGVEIENTVAWCRGTSRNLVKEHWRKSKNAKVVADSELMDLVEMAFDENSSDEEYQLDRRNALMTCLENLPNYSRDLLRLKYEKGLAFSKMSEQLERSSSSLMMALSRVRRALAECIERKLEPGVGG